MTNALPLAVILGLSPTGLYAARELGRQGVPLLGIDRAFACASLSRYLRHNEGVRYAADADALLATLTDLASGLHSKPLLIPTSDYYIEFMLRHHARLEETFLFSDCYRGAAEALLDKQRFHALCAEHGIVAPRVWDLSDISTADRGVAEIPVPCLLKPALIHVARPFLRGRKVLVARSHDELRSLARRLPAEAGGWLVQEIIPGAESSITLAAGYASNRADACDVFTARKLRQYPPGFGSASRVVSETCHETRELALRLVHAMGFQGIFGAEFKRDPRDGRLKIIEINPRPVLWFQLSHAAGKRLVETAYCDLAGRPVPARAEQRDGIHWLYALKDCASALQYRFGGSRLLFPAPAVPAGVRNSDRCWPVFSRRDPLPVVAESWVYITKLFRRAF